MNATLERDQMTEAYVDVADAMAKIARKFCQRYGEQYEEVKGEVHDIFIYAYTTYKIGKGPFESYCRFVTWKRLLELTRRNVYRHNRLARARRYNLDLVPQQGGGEWFVDFLDSLSEDAQQVARITMEAPPDIRMNVAQRGKNSKPRNVRAAIREYLIDCGWSRCRVTEAFEELSSMLNQWDKPDSN